MKRLQAVVDWLLLGLMVILFCPATSVAGESEIKTVDSGRVVANVRVRVVSTVSGRTVFEGTSDDQGLLFVTGLDENKRYQIQTDDGNVWSRPFESGKEMVFDLDGTGGWDLYGDVGVGLGRSAARYEAGTGSDATSAGLGVLLDIGVGTIGSPWYGFGFPIRPIIETGFEVPLKQSPTFTDQLGNDGTVRTSLRWRAGIGASSPFRLWGIDLSADAVLAYVLSDLKFKTKLAGSGGSTDHFLGHAIDLRLGTSAPLHKFGGVVLSATAGFSVLVPLAGKGVNSVGVDASEDVAYRGILGVRFTLPGQLGTRSRAPLR